MRLDISIEIWQKREWFIAKCPELDFVSQGTTREEARKNLLEVVEIQLEEMAEMGTLDEYLAECGYVRNEGEDLVPHIEMISLEKQAIEVH